VRRRVRVRIRTLGEQSNSYLLQVRSSGGSQDFGIHLCMPLSLSLLYFQASTSRQKHDVWPTNTGTERADIPITRHSSPLIGEYDPPISGHLSVIEALETIDDARSW
jgi:hypothetical protein